MEQNIKSNLLQKKCQNLKVLPPKMNYEFTRTKKNQKNQKITEKKNKKTSNRHEIDRTKKKEEKN